MICPSPHFYQSSTVQDFEERYFKKYVLFDRGRAQPLHIEYKVARPLGRDASQNPSQEVPSSRRAILSTVDTAHDKSAQTEITTV